jgi:hypothetical protein
MTISGGPLVFERQWIFSQRRFRGIARFWKAGAPSVKPLHKMRHRSAPVTWSRLSEAPLLLA